MSLLSSRAGPDEWVEAWPQELIRVRAAWYAVCDGLVDDLDYGAPSALLSSIKLYATVATSWMGRRARASGGVPSKSPPTTARREGFRRRGSEFCREGRVHSRCPRLRRIVQDQD